MSSQSIASVPESQTIITIEAKQVGVTLEISVTKKKTINYHDSSNGNKKSRRKVNYDKSIFTLSSSLIRSITDKMQKLHNQDEDL